MMSLFQFVCNSVYAGNKSCDFNNSTSNMNNCLINCEKHTNILNEIVNSHLNSPKKSFFQLKLSHTKNFLTTLFFKKFHTPCLSFFQIRKLSTVLLKWEGGRTTVLSNLLGALR